MAGLAPRVVAWRVLQAVAAGAYADAALERELAREPSTGPMATADRALATELAYGAIRQRLLLDHWIDALGTLPATKQPPKLRWLLHIGLYQLLFSDRIPPSAAVNTTVELTRQAGLAHLAPVVNGLLRNVLRRHQGAEPWGGLDLPMDPHAAFALRHSLPPWLVAELHSWCTPERAETFALAANATPPLDLRVNPLRTSRQALIDTFAAAGVAAEPIAELPLGLTLPARSGLPSNLPGYHEGHWCVQDRSAQRIALLLAPQPGQRILDACAAPGGKCTQIAELIGDQGEVWAVDRSEARLRRLARNAERLQLTAIQTLATDACELAGSQPRWRGFFDRVLLDAPCSGLGTLARHADARWRLTPAAIHDLVTLQARLLEGLVPLLAPGGLLVYATCTVHPQENGEQLAHFLAAHPEWRLITENQWWPGDGDGFYAAVLRAPGPADPDPTEP